MKNLLIYFLFSILAFAFIPTESRATNALTKTEVPNDTAIEKMRLRIDEIRNMDKSALSWNEKRELRKEVRTMEKTISRETGGVYIYVSVGLLLVLLIILLIILL